MRIVIEIGPGEIRVLEKPKGVELVVWDFFDAERWSGSVKSKIFREEEEIKEQK